MVATDSTLSFPDRRVAERRGLPSRRSGLDRRDQSIAVPLERRGGGERRIVADRRSWTERRRATATTRPVPAGGQVTGAPRTRKFEVDRAEYPFADRWFERGGSALHYVDEGSGPPVLMLHGNPTWSFLYRNVIKELGGACRSIAPDYPGFGLSDHPPGYGYTPQEHAEWIHALIDDAGLKGFVLVLQDWGGPIGLSIAVERPDDVAGLVILNTWAWPPDPRMVVFSLIMGGPIGKYLHLRRNFFARKIVPSGIARAERRTPAILKAYTDPFPTPASRTGTWVFPRAIRRSAAWLAEIERQLPRLRAKPVEFVWAMKDVAFGRERILARWLSYFPGAPVDRLPEAKHYLQEDEPERVAAAVKRVVARI